VLKKGEETIRQARLGALVLASAAFVRFVSALEVNDS
jgi:hypothetical protein